MTMRSINRVLGGALLVTLIFVGFGCRKPAKPPAPAPAPQAPVQQQAPKPPAPTTAAPQAPAQPGPEPSDQPWVSVNCNHPYYPLKDGNEIDYRVTSGGQSFDYVLKVSDVTDSSAKLSVSFTKPSPMTVVQNLQCDDGTIRTDGYLDMAAVSTGGKMKIETKSVSGDLMPKDLAVGTAWTTKYDTVITLQDPSLPQGFGNMTASVESTNKVLTEESITVPAGTYTALKVQVDTNTVVTIPGVPTGPSTTKMTNFQWWVKDVGMIKTVDAGGEAPVVATRVVIN